MKKIIGIFCMMAVMLPVMAINDTTITDVKYQKKLEKLKYKQQAKCIKNPEKCYAQTTPVQQTNLTLGTAQAKIKIGTTQEEVAMALGSPNIVTVDSEGRDTWIYDKVASVTSYNSSGFDIGAQGGGSGSGTRYNDNGYGQGGGGGLLNVGYSRQGGTTQSNQKTLTIVIKFTNQKVSSFNYHMSSF